MKQALPRGWWVAGDADHFTGVVAGLPFSMT